MSYIIMAIDECGSETRIEGGFSTMDAAQDHLATIREDYPEYRRIWAEELRDKAYYSAQRQDRYEYDEYDLY